VRYRGTTPASRTATLTAESPGATGQNFTINYVLGVYLDRRDRANRQDQEKDPGKDGEETGGKKPESLSEWVIFAFRELSRADFCFIVLGLGLFGLTWVLVPFGAIGAQVYWITQLLLPKSREYHV